MNTRKLLGTIMLFFSFLFLTNDLAFAEHQCTHQVVHSDGTVTISTDCSATYTTTSTKSDPGMYQVPYYLNTLENNLLDSVNGGTPYYQDPLATTPSGLTTADIKDKQEQIMDAQKIKQQEQENQLQNYKQQHSI